MIKLTADELSRIYSALLYRADENDPLVKKIAAALVDARRRT